MNLLEALKIFPLSMTTSLCSDLVIPHKKQSLYMAWSLEHPWTDGAWIKAQQEETSFQAQQGG